jgi:hypothetical protein
MRLMYLLVSHVHIKMHGIKTKILKLLLHTKFAAVAHLRKGIFLRAVGYWVKFVIL